MEKQSKTESNNTKWKVQIDGDKKYIDDLLLVFETLNFEPSIYKEGEDVYLESKVFDNIVDAKEISSKVKTLLTLLPVVPNFRTERTIESLKIVKIFHEDGGTKEVYDAEGNFLCKSDSKETILQIDPMKHSSHIGSVDLIQISEDGKFLGGLTTIESIKNYIENNRSNSDAMQKLKDYLKPLFENIVKYSENCSQEGAAEEMLTILTNFSSDLTTLKWIFLYRIYEIIEKEVDGKSKLKSKNWIEPNQVELFAAVANYYYRHSKFRVFKKDKPPSRKMSLSEAEELISTLLLKYIEEKVNGESK